MKIILAAAAIALSACTTYPNPNSPAEMKQAALTMSTYRELKGARFDHIPADQLVTVAENMCWMK